MIGDREIEVDISGTGARRCGSSEVLSSAHTDITRNLPWYELGYSVAHLFTDDEAAALKAAIERVVLALLREKVEVGCAFDLSMYHHFVSEDDHRHVVSRSRDLFPADF